jgi:hypothetical protein
LDQQQQPADHQIEHRMEKRVNGKFNGWRHHPYRRTTWRVKYILNSSRQGLLKARRLTSAKKNLIWLPTQLDASLWKNFNIQEITFNMWGDGRGIIFELA